jgi:phytoene dehydrogenase-like protein
MRRSRYDAVVIGSGPNGLAAAITLAQAGHTVLVREAAGQPGGGLRSAALTLPGFLHDVCASIHALGAASPLFRALPLAEHGLEWVTPEVPLAHPLDDGTAVMLERQLEATAEALGPDAAAYRALMGPLVRHWQALVDDVLGPLRLPRHPVLLARFARHALWPARTLAVRWFRTEPARALVAGLAAHSVLPLERPPTAAFGLILAAAAHAHGWPVARGGSQRLADALVAYLRRRGGEVVTGAPVRSLEELPPARAILCDLAPRHLLQLAGSRLPRRYARQLARFHYGPGVFKVDWALDGPIPWTAAACARAGTVHVGGTLEDIARAERMVWEGRLPERPFVLVTQPSVCDPTRAPAGCHTAWGYCHVPNGSDADLTDRIEAQIERFAPGFCRRILARHTRSAVQLEQDNANHIGGDITGGSQTLWQLLARPAARWNPYTTPVPGLYLCSASTPPGGGVHGMCGVHAARAALRRLRRLGSIGSSE